MLHAKPACRRFTPDLDGLKKTLLLLTALSVVGMPALALPDYEPFADATGSGGTSYAVGSFLAGQINAAGQSWWELGPNYGLGMTPQPTIAAGDLIVPGLYSAGGGRSAAFGGNGDSARLNLSVGPGGITAGTVYFSFAMRLTDLTGLTCGRHILGGVQQCAKPQRRHGHARHDRDSCDEPERHRRIQYRAPGRHQGQHRNTAWDSTVFTTSDTVFLVGSYTFNRAPPRMMSRSFGSIRILLPSARRRPQVAPSYVQWRHGHRPGCELHAV